MKYYVMFLLLVGAKVNACEICVEDIERVLEITKHYHEMADSEYWRAFTAGTLNGIKISSDIYYLNHSD